MECFCTKMSTEERVTLWVQPRAPGSQYAPRVPWRLCHHRCVDVNKGSGPLTKALPICYRWAPNGALFFLW